MPGLIWELLLEPALMWLSRKWVSFVGRKQRIWTPGNPFPVLSERLWDCQKHASIRSLGFPWQMFPLPRYHPRWLRLATRFWR
jgi:hypothetical protein